MPHTLAEYTNLIQCDKLAEDYYSPHRNAQQSKEKKKKSEIAAKRFVHPGPYSLADTLPFAADATPEPGCVLKDYQKLLTDIQRIVLLTHRNGTRIQLHRDRNVPQNHTTYLVRTRGG